MAYSLRGIVQEVRSAWVSHPVLDDGWENRPYDFIWSKLAFQKEREATFEDRKPAAIARFVLSCGYCFLSCGYCFLNRRRLQLASLIVVVVMVWYVSERGGKGT